MDYKRFVKKFVLPAGFKASERLEYEDLVAKPLTRADLKADLKAANSSIETIHNTRGGSWPEGELNEKFNELDLAWHEREFREATSFAYVVHDINNNYVGCFYLYPIGGERSELTSELTEYDVDASWWVTKDAYEKNYYQKLYKAINQWLSQSFPFQKVYYSNKVIPS
jgi:hypothetical protein